MNPLKCTGTFDSIIVSLKWCWFCSKCLFACFRLPKVLQLQHCITISHKMQKYLFIHSL